jgi:peptidase E
MGGGGFTMEPDNPVLDAFVLALPDRSWPRICFLPTASGDPTEQIRAFHARFDDWPCEPSTIELFRLGQRPIDLREHLLAQDIIYVGGGSMRNLLAIWREHGLDRILAEAWRSGVVLCGLSAGAMCWFEGGISKSSGEPEVVAGLGLLPGSMSVHDDGEPDRHHIYLEAVRSGRLPGGYCADDGVGLLFHGRRRVDAVSSREGAGASRVRLPDGGELVVEPIPVRDLRDRSVTPSPTIAPASSDIGEMRRLRAGPGVGAGRRRQARYGE